MHAPVRSAFATTDPDEGMAMVAAAYGDNRLQISGDVEDFRMAQRRVDLGGVRLDEYSNSLVTEYAFEPLAGLNIVRVLGRTVEYRTARCATSGGPGDVLLAGQPGEAYDARVDGARLQVIGVDLTLVEAVTGEPGGPSGHGFRTAPLDPVAARHWQRTVDYVTGTVLANEQTAASALVLGAAGRLLVTTFLTVFDPNGPDAHAFDRADATPESVRRAVAYIEAVPDLDITVADIARHAYVSVRTLQIAFRRHLNSTPMAFLRRVRLDLAHDDLVTALPGDGTTVTDVAMRWGYADASRFAADYRSAFREHPSATLRS